MAELLEQIKHKQLSAREQLALIREITLNLERSDEADEWELSPEDHEELSKRVAAANANPLEGDDWATVRARIEAQLGQNRERVEAHS